MNTLKGFGTAHPIIWWDEAWSGQAVYMQHWVNGHRSHCAEYAQYYQAIAYLLSDY